MNVVVREGTIEEAVQVSMEIGEFQGPPDINEYKKRLHAVRYLVLIADVQGKAKGFKVGYDRHLDGETFYSWMGGVLEEYRHLGLATALLEKMEAWCRSQGFRKLQFKTRNVHTKMIGFAYARGFWLVDFKKKENAKDNRLVFEKELQ